MMHRAMIRKTRKTKAMTPMTMAMMTPELSPGEWYSTFGSAASVSDDVAARAGDVEAMVVEGMVVDDVAGLEGELPGLAVCDDCDAMVESPPVVAGTLGAGAVPSAPTVEPASGGGVVPPTRTNPSSVPPTTDTSVPASGSPPALTHGQVKPGIGAPE